MKVYPIGYSTPRARERIDELLQTKTLLIDTRITPWSWDEQWRKEALEDRYGDKYKFAGKYLGNLEKDSGLIRIADLDTGILGLMRYFDQGYDLILLCQCKIYDKCHVSHIVDRLLQLLIVEVVKFEQAVQPNILRCFSTKPPYGSWLANPQRFIDAGLPPKRIENNDRDFTEGYRGPVWIHQSKNFDKEAFKCWEEEMPGIEKIFSLEEEGYPHGCFVGQADLIDVIEDSEDPWFVGDYGIVLANARPIDPIPYPGKLGLFTVDRNVLAKFEPMSARTYQRAKPKRSSLEEDAAELREIFEPERMIICQRSGQGKGCVMTWAVGNKVTAHIPFRGDVHGIVRGIKTEGLTQKVQLRIAVYNPLGQSYIISEDKRWFDGSSLSPRVSVIPELGEKE
jgi:hypothetical protein